MHSLQLLLDYPLAFAHWAWLGRFVCHFISGIVWFGQYAPDGTPVA
ncbi:energy-coupled thiamine transporter ThiT [Brevibacillus choshinensis]